jgi:hypothetical protein
LINIQNKIFWRNLVMKRMMRFLLCAILALTLLASMPLTAFADEGPWADVHIRVICSETHNHVQGAQVAFYVGTTRVYTGSTDRSGEIEFYSSTQGTYEAVFLSVPDGFVLPDDRFTMGTLGNTDVFLSRGFRLTPGTTPPAEATPPEQAPDLSTASTWAQEGITRAIDLGLVPQNLQSAYTQATTRAEFAALAVTLYETLAGREIAIDRSIIFSDTTDVNVHKAATIGVVTGVGDNRFDPDTQLTREQAAVMLSRLAQAIGQPFPDAAPSFADNADISSWAIEAVGQMQAAEIMGGVGDNRFAPQDPYTREQSIITLLRLFDIVN